MSPETVILDDDAVSFVARLLRQINDLPAPDQELADACVYTADRMHQEMATTDVDTVVELLDRVAANRSHPGSLRGRARFWSERLGRLVEVR